MSLNLGGLATLSSITLSRPGGDDGETLATLKLSIGTKDTDPVCAALGTESGDALEWGVGTASGVAGGAVVSDLSHDSPGVQGLAQLGRNAIDRVSELEREREETIRKLRDPVAVHVAMLRGEIAVPPLAELLHVYGATFSDLDAANIELAKARAEFERGQAILREEEENVRREDEERKATPAAPVRIQPKQAAPESRIKLGDINAAIAPLSITADGLAQLGFPHVATDKAAKLYDEASFEAILSALAKTIARADLRREAA